MTTKFQLSIAIGLELQTLKTVTTILNNQVVQHDYLPGAGVVEENQQLFEIINNIMNDSPDSDKLKEEYDKYFKKINKDK